MRGGWLDNRSLVNCKKMRATKTRGGQGEEPACDHRQQKSRKKHKTKETFTVLKHYLTLQLFSFSEQYRCPVGRPRQIWLVPPHAQFAGRSPERKENGALFLLPSFLGFICCLLGCQERQCSQAKQTPLVFSYLGPP